MSRNCQTSDMVNNRRISWLTNYCSLKLGSSLAECFILENLCRFNTCCMLESKEQWLKSVENRSQNVTFSFRKTSKVNLASVFLNSLNSTTVLDEHCLTSCLKDKVSKHVKWICTIDIGNIHQHNDRFLVLNCVNIKTVLEVTFFFDNIINKNVKSFRFKCDT